MKNTVVIHGIKYKAVDSKRERDDFTCKDCDIYKAKIPQNIILAFPNEEMRDAFYENFKDLIERCKELL